MFDFTRNFDLPVLDWIAEHLWCPFLDGVMPAVTHLGDGGILWIVLGLVLLCIPKWRNTGLAVMLALAVGLLVCNLGLKPLVGRLRPFDYVQQCFQRTIPLLITAPTDYSFPSGHTIASFEAATVLLLRKKPLGIAAMAAAVMIGFSRLYLYVHYPTDVLASVALGVIIGLMAHWAANRIPASRRQKFTQ